MNTCAGCNVDFADTVTLFPRLIETAPIKTAKKLAETDETVDRLCLGCWLEAAATLEPKQMITLLLAFTQKIEQLQQLCAVKKFPTTEYPWVEKTRTGDSSVVYGSQTTCEWPSWARA